MDIAGPPPYSLLCPRVERVDQFIIDGNMEVGGGRACTLSEVKFRSMLLMMPHTGPDQWVASGSNVEMRYHIAPWFEGLNRTRKKRKSSYFRQDIRYNYFYWTKRLPSIILNGFCKRLLKRLKHDVSMIISIVEGAILCLGGYEVILSCSWSVIDKLKSCLTFPCISCQRVKSTIGTQN